MALPAGFAINPGQAAGVAGVLARRCGARTVAGSGRERRSGVVPARVKGRHGQGEIAADQEGAGEKELEGDVACCNQILRT